jgi:hypothetical protein
LAPVFRNWLVKRGLEAETPFGRRMGFGRKTNQPPKISVVRGKGRYGCLIYRVEVL